MLWVLGGLCMLGGVCAVLAVWFVPLDQFVNELRQSLSPAQQNQLAGFDLKSILRVLYSVVGGLAVLLGLIMVIAAFFVRQGRRGAILTALVVAALIGLWCVLAVLGGLVQAARGSGAALGGVIIWILIGMAIAWLIGWLMQALRAARQPDIDPQAGQPHWPAQDRFGLGAGGYGYAPPPPGPAPQQWMPPPPPTSPPPMPLPPPAKSPWEESQGNGNP